MSMRKLIAAGALFALCSAAFAESPNLGKPISPGNDVPPEDRTLPCARE